MNKAVQVGLVFPRSGQQLLVQLPLAYAESLGVTPPDPKAPQVTMTHCVSSQEPGKNLPHAR